MDILSGVVIGLHLVSFHVPAEDWQNNLNLGAYVRTESGLTVGAFRNTLDRTSVYVAQSFEYRQFSLTLGAITGYQKERIQTDPGANGRCADGNAPPCMIDRGKYGGKVGPLVALSYALPKVGVVTPRLTLIPPMGSGDATTLHLSVEF